MTIIGHGRVGTIDQGLTDPCWSALRPSPQRIGPTPTSLTSAHYIRSRGYSRPTLLGISGPRDRATLASICARRRSIFARPCNSISTKIQRRCVCVVTRPSIPSARSGVSRTKTPNEHRCLLKRALRWDCPVTQAWNHQEPNVKLCHPRPQSAVRPFVVR